MKENLSLIINEAKPGVLWPEYPVICGCSPMKYLKWAYTYKSSGIFIMPGLVWLA